MKFTLRLIASLLLAASVSFGQNAMLRDFSCVDVGANDTYACNLATAPSGYVSGQRYQFTANTANTGAATINLNSLGAKTIKKVAGGITTDLNDNDIRAGQIVLLVYDGTNMQMQSGLGNAPSGGSSNGVLTMTLTAVTTPSGTQFYPAVAAAGPGNIQGGSDANFATIMPNAITGTALYVKLTAAEGAAATLAVTVEKNGADAALTCTVGNSVTTCNLTGQSVAWAAGDTMSIKTVQTGTGTSQAIKTGVAYQ